MKILFLILLLNIFVFPQVKFSQINIDSAQSLANNENKKVLIDYFTDWCIPCKELNKYIFEDSTISEYINQHYICLRINAEKDYGSIIGKKLNLQKMYPTVILLASNGNEIDRIVGLIPVEGYFQKIKDYTEDINTFTQLLEKEKNDDSDSLKYQIAIKYFERGNFETAIHYYKYLTKSEMFNSDGDIYYKIGYDYSLIGNIDKAKEYIRKAINKNSSSKYYKEFLEKLNNE
jgi:tetratricopeptide (TPR) repeat protein